MERDIRERVGLDHADILRLNFVRAPSRFVFRRHYRAGLRSHLMEVLRPEDLERERKGTAGDGPRTYPRAVPVKMLRIFRSRFPDPAAAREELMREKIVERFLAPDHMARSEEFLVDYLRDRTREILLCGLQEYVKGEILDPWGHLDRACLESLHRRMASEGGPAGDRGPGYWFEAVRASAEGFVDRTRRMILEAGHVPDLAGVGNLLLTPAGGIRLVDINNISRVSFDGVIQVDDRGYPVCDKAIEALSLLEAGLLGRRPRKEDPIYGVFLTPGRMSRVREMEAEFHRAMAVGGAVPPPPPPDERRW
ncbi:MAG: hypothetical protein DRH56_07980 [Deltaproteobacteria bacterium]|nr:MAG: hypothetical protein DRH56_07980 [Deltaproteobacteria bacterium]